MEKTKRVISALLAISLAFCLAACGNKNSDSAPKASNSPVSKSAATQSSASVAKDTKTDKTTSKDSTTAEWRTFLKDYEKWVDRYLAFLPKYMSDSSDPQVVAEYEKLEKESEEWSKRAEKVTNELENSPEDLEEFTNELSKILEKILGAAE